MNLEIGGGSNFARGAGWINIDQCQDADIQHDLNVLPWPVADDSADAIYSSHCIEHVENSNDFFFECVRIGKIGSTVIIKCPAPFSEMALCSGHKSVISPQQVRNMEHEFPRLVWRKPKRLKLLSCVFNASQKLKKAKGDLRFLIGMTDQQIMEWIPGTAHETVFEFIVQENEFYENH